MFLNYFFSSKKIFKEEKREYLGIFYLLKMKISEFNSLFRKHDVLKLPRDY